MDNTGHDENEELIGFEEGQTGKVEWDGTHISAVMRELDSDGYFDFKKSMKYGDKCPTMMFMGGRGVGKTCTGTHLVCKAYLDHGIKSLWIRTTKEEMKHDFINNFLNSALEFEWCPEDWSVNETGVWTSKYDGDQIVRFASLSTYGGFRGNKSPINMECIIYDEFCPEDRKYYCKEPNKAIMSICETAFRRNPHAKLLMFANNVSVSNPFMCATRVFPKKGYDVTVFNDKGISLEICRGYKRSNDDEDNPWRKTYSAFNYSMYDDETDHELFKLIEKVPKGAKLQKHCFMTDSGNYVYYMKDGICYWDLYNGDTKDMFHYTNKAEMMAPGIYSYKFLEKFIKEGIDSGSFRYATPNVLYAVMTLVYNV